MRDSTRFSSLYKKEAKDNVTAVQETNQLLDQPQLSGQPSYRCEETRSFL
ncbi:hypothetical protein [Shimazuella soli]|nr:hypothetical protein [Shimazuella soli]